MIIYKITNSVNNKIYVGQTKTDINKRFKQHLGCKQHDFPIYKAISKYGPDKFSIALLEEVLTPEMADISEKKWISYFKSNKSKFGYNATSGGKNEFSPNKNVRNKISHGLTGLPKTKEHKNKLRKHLAKLNVKGHAAKTYIVTSPDGSKILVNHIKSFCVEHKLAPQNLRSVARGVSSHHKGYKAEFA